MLGNFGLRWVTRCNMVGREAAVAYVVVLTQVAVTSTSIIFTAYVVV